MACSTNGKNTYRYGKSIVAVSRIEEILQNYRNCRRKPRKPNIYGNVSFKDVCFEYESEKPILKESLM